MLESSIQTAIRKHLKKDGWMVIKLISTSQNGIPDLMCIKDGRVIFFEVKQPGKKVIPGGLQEYMINELRKQGVEAYEVHSVTEVKSAITHSTAEKEVKLIIEKLNRC